MKKTSLLLLFILLLVLPSSSFALVEVGAGFNITSFEDDLDNVNSSHNQGDYDAWMVGPSFTLDTEGFNSRIYALLSSHDFEGIDGWGVTLGGGLGWPIFQSASFGFDLRISQWEGDGGRNVGTGTLQVLFRVGF
jgi:hypothetical protein